MKGTTSWSFAPYTSPLDPQRAEKPYICRIAPSETGFTFDFIDNGAENASYTLLLRKRFYSEFEKTPISHKTVTVDGLDTPRDYEFCVERDDGKRSSVRTVRTGYVPGTVVNYLHPDDNEYAFSGKYLCSPSLIRLDDGRLLASMDVFEGYAAQNLTLIYESCDDGKTWKHLAELFPCFWGKMFLICGKLYMLGCSCEYGDLLIGRSDDGGRSWTVPTAIFRGSGLVAKGSGWHRAPMPVIIHNGLVLTDVQYGSWLAHTFGDSIISAPIDSDLLDPTSWSCTALWEIRKHPELAEKLPKGIAGGIEGNVVISPDGTVYDMLRIKDKSALFLKFNPEAPEASLEFDEIIDFPCTASKWDVQYDEVSKKYFAVASFALDEPKTTRNLLSLICSDDLKHWTLVTHLIDCREEDPRQVGFQYVSFIIDGDDILYLSRTAYNGAHNFHDANYQTFHRLKNFRTLIG